jgi:anti-sigma B factor antagonist
VISEGSIRVGVQSGVVWIRVEGKGSFQNSTALKDFAKAMMARGHRRFVVDLEQCPLMDSTFMGTLAGIALRMQGVDPGLVEVVRLNARTRSLLSNLGLDQILRLCDEVPGERGQSVPPEAPETPETLSQVPCDKRTQAATMLEAHQAVVDVNPENQAKFKDVLEFLRQDLGMKA